jgi:hypothetical protein
VPVPVCRKETGWGERGQTAEQFGNSEGIIKAHYQGRVSSAETKKFYALRPAAGTAKADTKHAKIASDCKP